MSTDRTPRPDPVEPNVGADTGGFASSTGRGTWVSFAAALDRLVVGK